MRLWPFTFGSKEPPTQKASLETVEAPMSYLNALRLRERYTDALAADLYQNSAVVHACITIISRAASTLPLMLTQGDDAFTVDDPPPAGSAADRVLRLVMRPNETQSAAEFFATAATHYFVFGRLFMEADVSPNGTGVPIALRLHNPRKIRVRTSNDGATLIGFEVYAGVAPDVERTLYHHTVHPESPHDFVSPLAPLVPEVMAIEEIAEWRLRLVKQGVRGLFVNLEEPLSEEQVEFLLERIREEWEGPQNAGKIKLLFGRASVNEVGVSPTDVDWLEGYREARRAVCAALGVPPEMVGDDQSKTFANWREARRSLYTETVLPFMEGLLDEMNAKWFAPLGISLKVARHEIEVLRDSPADETARLRDAFWMTLNERRADVGLPPIEDTLADVVLIPSSLLPLSDAADLAEEETASNGVHYDSKS